MIRRPVTLTEWIAVTVTVLIWAYVFHALQGAI
jgi:hypothetical protein